MNIRLIILKSNKYLTQETQLISNNLTHLERNARLNFKKRCPHPLQNNKLYLPLQPQIMVSVRWCNGNTGGFGSLVPGSSPGRTTTLRTGLSEN